MKLVLVDNLLMPAEGSLHLLDIHPHLGLLALAASAEADGHVVEIYDPKRAVRWGQLSYDESLYEQATTAILGKRPDAVGFTTLGCSFLFAVRVAAGLKRLEPDLPILLGGPHATMLHREILERFPQFDVIVRHEADETFPLVLRNLNQRQFYFIPGISWRSSPVAGRLQFNDGRPKVEDLDTLPFLSYDHYPISELGLPLLRVEAGRGCPFLCTFCSTAGFFQRSFRLKSAARLVEELDRLRALYGFSDFKLDHDMFTVNRRKVIEFCEAVKGRGYRWRVSARVDGVDAELLRQMADAGCVGLYFGIETGSARMQKICKKGLDLSLVDPVLDAASELGIETTLSFITGYPEEEGPDQGDTLDMIGRCVTRASLVQLHMLVPEPETPLFDERRHAIERDGYSSRYNAWLTGPADEHMIREHPEIFSSYYYYPAAMPRWHYIFAVETLELLRHVGPEILDYTLRAFQGRLSVFVERFRRFAELNGYEAAPTARAMEAFLAAEFGDGHHLLSLFRYAFCTQEPPPAATRFCTGDMAAAYTISPIAHILSKVHHCGFVLERIRMSPPSPKLLADAEFGERSTFLILANGEASTFTPVDSGLEVILTLFQESRTLEEAARYLRRITHTDDLGSEFFRPLIDAGILVGASLPESQSVLVGTSQS